MKDLHLKRITRATGERQAVLIIGSLDGTIKEGILKNNNSVSFIDSYEELSSCKENSYTRVVCSYKKEVFENPETFKYLRSIILPTGKLIIAAVHEKTFFQNLFKRKVNFPENSTPINPKSLQDKIHDNGFLIEGYYGYTGNHLVMISEIYNKEVSTLFDSKDQTTLKNIQDLIKR